MSCKSQSCKAQSNRARRCGQRPICATLIEEVEKPIVHFGISSKCRGKDDSLLLTAGPSAEQTTSRTRICCCGEEIHFFGDCMDIEVNPDGSISFDPVNIIDVCTGAFDETSVDPAPSETIGKIAVNKITSELFYSSANTDGWIPVGNIVGVPGLTCGALVVGGPSGMNIELLPGEEGQHLVINSEGKPEYQDQTVEGLGLTCGSLIVGGPDNLSIALPTTNDDTNVLGQDSNGKPIWKTVATTDLTDYDVSTVVVEWGNAWSPAQTGTAKIVQIGSLVNLNVSGVFELFNATGPIVSDAVFPGPPSTISDLIVVDDGSGVGKVGSLQVESSGVITIFSDASNGVFDAGATGGFFNFSTSYNI